MARLYTWQDGLWGIVEATPASGPMARNSGGNTASDGSEQTFEGIGDVVALDLALSAKNGRFGARWERGILRGMGAGVNGVRLTYHDPDIMTPPEAGISGSFGGQEWSNEEPWSNGMPWGASYPVVPIAAASDYDSGIVRLGSAFWGHTLGLGDYVGFFPFYFGLHCVTEVLGPGRYRVWPRLRKALTTDDFATLHPTLVMRPTAGSGVPPGRGLASTTSMTLRLVEVIDPYVRQHFTD